MPAFPAGILKRGRQIGFALFCISMAIWQTAFADEAAHDDHIHDFMTLQLEPAAGHIWDSAGWVVTEAGERELWPTTAAGWEEVAVAAQRVADLARRLRSSEFAPNTPGPPPADWLVVSENLEEIAKEIKKTARNRDKQGLFDRGGDMYLICVSCHDRYMIGHADGSE